MIEKDEEIKEKSLIIKEFLVEGYSLNKIDSFMKMRKDYRVENCFDFMQNHSENFKDITFKRRK